MKGKNNYYEMRKQALQDINMMVMKQRKVERSSIYLMLAERYGITNNKFADNYIWLKIKAGFFKANKEIVEWVQ